MDHRIGIHDFVYRSNRPIVKNAKKVHFQLNQFNGFTEDSRVYSGSLTFDNHDFKVRLIHIKNLNVE